MKGEEETRKDGERERERMKITQRGRWKRDFKYTQVDCLANERKDTTQRTWWSVIECVCDCVYVCSLATTGALQTEKKYTLVSSFFSSFSSHSNPKTRSDKGYHAGTSYSCLLFFFFFLTYLSLSIYLLVSHGLCFPSLTRVFISSHNRAFDIYSCRALCQVLPCSPLLLSSLALIRNLLLSLPHSLSSHDPQPFAQQLVIFHLTTRQEKEGHMKKETQPNRQLAELEVSRCHYPERDRVSVSWQTRATPCAPMDYDGEM